MAKKPTYNALGEAVAPTKTIGFRVPARVYDRVQESAKEEGVDMQTYFLSQVDPKSKLAGIIREELQVSPERFTKIAVVVLETLMTLSKIKEDSGLSDEDFSEVMKSATKEVLKSKDIKTVVESKKKDIAIKRRKLGLE